MQQGNHLMAVYWSRLMIQVSDRLKRMFCRLTEINSREYQEQHATMLAANQLKQGDAPGNAM